MISGKIVDIAQWGGVKEVVRNLFHDHHDHRLDPTEDMEAEIITVNQRKVEVVSDHAHEKGWEGIGTERTTAGEQLKTGAREVRHRKFLIVPNSERKGVVWMGDMRNDVILLIFVVIYCMTGPVVVAEAPVLVVEVVVVGQLKN